MNNQERIRVFIGSGEASLLERKVAIYSLRKHSKRELDIYVFNGTHNAIELNDQEIFAAPLSLELKYHNITEFSLYRYLIPQLCGYQGKAIYLDSDVICLTDISKLFDSPLEGCDFLAKQDAYQDMGANLWALSVILIDCAKCRFKLETFYQEIAQQLYSQKDFACMSPSFLAHHPYKIGKLDPCWNVLDYADHSTKLIHYTNLHTQPWKHPHHPYGELWFTYFHEAISAGYITKKDIDLSLARSYVRRDIMKGNSPLLVRLDYIKRYIGVAKKSLQKLYQPEPA
jgi:lipopolysaccharide biosynthesis glycosyltransferase